MKQKKFKERINEIHPLVQLLYILTTLGMIMFTRHPLIQIEAFVFGILYRIRLQTDQKEKISSLLFLFLIIGISAVINGLTYHDGLTILFYMNDNAITGEAIWCGSIMGFMIVNAILWMSIYQKIMTEERFLYLFGRISPVFALMISMVFCYLPLLRRRYNKIHQANQMMGAYTTAHGLQSMKMRAKEISTLVSWSLEDSIDTALYMEAREYGKGKRTSFHRFIFTAKDKWMMILILCLAFILIAMLYLGYGRVFFYPVFECKVGIGRQIVLLFCYALLLIMPIIYGIKREKRYGSI